MTTVGQAAIFAFTGFNAIRVLGYVPQMLKIWRDRRGAEAVSAMTWALFALSHLSTVLYAIVAAGDYFMAAVFAGNAVCCAMIVGLIGWSRSTYARAVANKSPLDGHALTF